MPNTVLGITRIGTKQKDHPMPDDSGSKAKSSKQRRLADASLDDRGSAVIEIERGKWNSISQEIRVDQLRLLDERYHLLLNELYGSANLCVDRYQAFSKTHSGWRRAVIIGTGVVAVVNLLVANKRISGWSPDYAPIVPAVIAVVVAILANLESFYNALERAQAYRESRELFLDVAREFDRRWDNYVHPLGDDADACLNASELYRQLVAKDRELRGKFKELTKTESKSSGRK
jgi:hypothetical protein